MKRRRTFATRLVAVLLLLLLGYGSFVALAFRHEAARREAESLQRLSQDLARHIVEHWPQIADADPAAAERAARQSVLGMLMAVNPGVQVYLLDADGRVADYLGEPGMVREPQVDLAPVRRFLAGEALPLRGTDPMGSGQPRLFSAAMFPARADQKRAPGYLYVVLDGRARQQVADATDRGGTWWSAGLSAALGLALAAAIGAFTLRRMTRPLHRLAARMRRYSDPLSQGDANARSPDAMAPEPGDEVQILERSFDQMIGRIEAHAERERAQTSAHRETMASVAHDLRTPLTALHGHLEALGPALAAPADDPRARLLRAALAQSDKVRQLSQQLFELAALQSTNEVPHRERFRLDELVADSVGKFQLLPSPPAVLLAGTPPGRLEVEGDLQLLERALTNLIDNARRHGRGSGPVRVSVAAQGGQAEVVVEDSGPGLPAELHRRLSAGQSVREPPLRRASGGIGGLGLAIAQRVAALHGGTLQPLPTPHGGTRLCLALPLVR
jgi:signal transduction histidine kinase